METGSEKKIKVIKNGPYQVKGKIPLNQLRFIPNAKGFSLSYEKVKDYPEQDVYFLCRCGNSKKKPFCDGSHNQGFNGTETAGHKTYEEMAVLIEGEYINILDAKELCAFARFCDVKGGTWNLVERGFALETKDWVIQQCADCPAGRLTAVTKEGKVLEPELPQEVSLLDDTSFAARGPIWVKGGIAIEDADGKIYPVRNRVTLCRCGRSKSKPLCDGAHLKNKGELNKE